MGIEHDSASIAELAATLDNARIMALRLRYEAHPTPGDEMLNPKRHFAMIHSDIEAAIIRLHYVGEIILCNE